MIFGQGRISGYGLLAAQSRTPLLSDTPAICPDLATLLRRAILEEDREV